MLRRFVWLVLPLVAVTSCAPALVPGSSTYFGFTVGIEGAPPPPRVEFAQDPDIEQLPGTNVYVVANSDYDLFQCDGGWYMTYGGYWYRAPSYSGPFIAVDVRRVPRQVLRIPPGQWRAQMNGRHRGWDRRDRDDRDDDNH